MDLSRYLQGSLREHWKVNLGAGEARHISGLTVRFTRENARLIAQSKNQWEMLASLRFYYGGHLAAEMLARYMRDATDAFQYAIDKSQLPAGSRNTDPLRSLPTSAKV